MFTFYTPRKGRIKTSIDISNREVKGLWGQRGMIVIISTGYQNTALVVALKECTVLRDQYVQWRNGQSRQRESMVKLKKPAPY